MVVYGMIYLFKDAIISPRNRSLGAVMAHYRGLHGHYDKKWNLDGEYENKVMVF